MINILDKITISSNLSDVFELAVSYKEKGMTVAIILDNFLDFSKYVEYYTKHKELIYNKSERVLYSTRSEAKIFLIKRDCSKMAGLNVHTVIVHCGIEDFNKEFVKMCEKLTKRTRK